MKKKNYIKLKIKNNKIILKEEGTKYGQLGTSAGSKLTQMLGDSLKMVKATVQRAWGATFLYGYNIITSMMQDGIKGLHSANQQFHRDDAALRREQMQLIASQPGNKDAKMFMGMACPAALAFDKYVDTDLSIFRKAAIKATKDIKDAKKKKFGDEKDDYESRVTYTNLVTIISHLSDNTPLNLVEVKYDRTDDKVPILKSVKKNIKKDRFRSMSKYLQKFYKSKDQAAVEDKKTQKDEDTFYIGSEMKEILEMLYKKESDNKIIAYITKKRISSVIKRKAKNFIDNKKRKTKIKTEFAEFIKDFVVESFKAKLAFSNNELILELKDTEAESNTDNSIKKKKNKVDGKTGMMLSFSEYYLLGMDILMLLIEIQMKKSSAMTITNEKLLETLSKKEDFDNNLESLITDIIKEINDLTNDLEEKLPLLKKFKVKIDKPATTDIKEFSKNLKENLEMIEKSHEEIKNASDEIKDFTYSQIMLDIVKKVKPAISKVDPETLKDSVSESVKTINKYASELEENFKEVCEKNSNLLLQNKINYQEITSKKENFMKEFSQVYKNLEASFDNIENFTKKESELESFIEEKKDEIENQEGEDNSSEDSKDIKVAESDFIKAELVKILDSE